MSIASFVESRLEVGPLYGTRGGASFNTTVVQTGGGHEKRNSNHSINIGRWDLGSKNLRLVDIQYVHDFFRARRGMAQGFRFKDYLNYKASTQNAYPDGSPTLQLVKDFTDGGETDQMWVQKPISTGFSMLRNAVAFAAYTLDDTTGIVSLTADWSGSVTAITQANPGVITVAGHGRSSGDEIHLSGLGGMTELNDQVVTITVIDANTFSIGVDTTAYGAFTSGGTAAKYVQSSETLTWSGEFDIPVRFDVDQFPGDFVWFRETDEDAVFNLGSLPIVGLKL